MNVVDVWELTPAALYRRLMQHWRQLLPADAILELPYEALVADPNVDVVYVTSKSSTRGHLFPGS